jgi:chromosome partitioning protein
MASCIAFHSYKGGTGKTIIDASLAALLATKGYLLFLRDLDVYTQSLQAYFDKEPKKWINDFLNGTGEVGDVMMDLTSMFDICNDTKNSISSKENEKKPYMKMNNG